MVTLACSAVFVFVTATFSGIKYILIPEGIDVIDRLCISDVFGGGYRIDRMIDSWLLERNQPRPDQDEAQGVKSHVTISFASHVTGLFMFEDDWEKKEVDWGRNSKRRIPSSKRNLQISILAYLS